MGLAAAAGAPAAGALVALGGYATLCLAGAALGGAVVAATRPFSRPTIRAAED